MRSLTGASNARGPLSRSGSGCGAGDAGGALRRALGAPCWWRCWGFSRRAPPTCRSMPGYPQERLSLDAGRQRRAGAASPRRAWRPGCRRRGRGCPARRAMGEDRTRERIGRSPTAPATAADPGLCDLHLGLDRPAEGRGGAAPRGRPPGAGRPTTSRLGAGRAGWRQLSNVSFDAATFEIWGALLHGGDPGGRAAGDAPGAGASWRRSCAERRITVLFLTTALFNQMAQRGAGGVRVRCATCCSAARRSIPERCGGCCADGPPERLLHVYGPTENTTFSTWYRGGHGRRGCGDGADRPADRQHPGLSPGRGAAAGAAGGGRRAVSRRGRPGPRAISTSRS